MNTHRYNLNRFAVILAAICLAHPIPCHSAPRSSEDDFVSKSAVDQTNCLRQMNFLYGALQEYQKRNHSLPRWLSELVPDYIHDPKMLVCPFVDQTGKFKEWRRAFGNYPVFADPGSCSYAYEFCTIEIASVPGLTTRDYKQRQMAMIGFGVPVVRCLAHRPILNLARDGSTYLSPSEWEDNYAVSPNHQQAFHDVWSMTFTQTSLGQIIRSLLDERAPQLGAGSLDLSSYYNASLLHLSRIEQSGKVHAPSPEGLRKIRGIEFDARGLIQLSGKDFPIPSPEKMLNITVNRKCVTMHFLHGAIFPAAQGSTIASYILHFRGGATNEVPVIYGKDVNTRWFDAGQESEIRSPEAAWVSPPGLFGSVKKSLRLYLTTWKHPAGPAELESIEFISRMTPAAPFLVAITVE